MSTDFDELDDAYSKIQQLRAQVQQQTEMLEVFTTASGFMCDRCEALAPPDYVSTTKKLAHLVNQQAEALRVAREALEFYADQEHFIIHDRNAWDTVSGEPINLWEDESNTATVEDGSIAKAQLAAIDALPTVPAQDALAEYGERVREACVKECEDKYRVLEARRAHSDSMTLGGANHSYFTQVMSKVAECAQAIRAMPLPKPDVPPCKHTKTTTHTVQAVLGAFPAVTCDECGEWINKPDAKGGE